MDRRKAILTILGFAALSNLSLTWVRDGTSADDTNTIESLYHEVRGNSLKWEEPTEMWFDFGKLETFGVRWKGESVKFSMQEIWDALAGRKEG